MTRALRHGLLVVTVLLVAGCAATDGAEQPRDGRAGVQMSGRIDSAGAVAVSDGRPRLWEGDCEDRTGVPADVCVATRGIGGAAYVLGFGNLDRLPRGERVTVTTGQCASAAACAEVDEGALVLLAVDGALHRPTGGTALVREAERGERYLGRVRLDVDGGSVSIEFDVVPEAPQPQAPDRPQQGEPFTPDEVEPFEPE